MQSRLEHKRTRIKVKNLFEPINLVNDNFPYYREIHPRTTTIQSHISTKSPPLDELVTQRSNYNETIEPSVSRSKEIRVVKREEEEDSYGKRNWRVGGGRTAGGRRMARYARQRERVEGNGVEGRVRYCDPLESEACLNRLPLSSGEKGYRELL